MAKKALMLFVAATIILGGFMTWRAEATAWVGAKQLLNAAQSTKSIQGVACRGTGAHCPPGYVWNGVRCVPC